MQAEDNKRAESSDTKDSRENKSDAPKNKAKSGKYTTRYAYVTKRKQSHARRRHRLVKVPFSDHPFSPEVRLLKPIPETVPISQIEFFTKREMTTIHEEVRHFKHSKSNPALKAKAYKDKVASLKTIVKRLRRMCVAHPDVLKNAPPEEVLELFSRIEI